MPKKHLFWAVVFLRVGVPVDVLSYGLGLFSKMPLKDYFFATLLGVSPFAFVFSFLGIFPIYYQIFALAAALTIMTIGLKIVKKGLF